MTPIGPPGPQRMLSEAEKRYARSLHREKIKETREKAKLCREQYDEQIRETGEIGRELYDELVAAAFGFYMEVRPACLGTELEDDLEEISDLFDRVLVSDKRVWEMDDVSPKTFASLIDMLDAIVVKTGLLNGEP